MENDPTSTPPDLKISAKIAKEESFLEIKSNQEYTEWYSKFIQFLEEHKTNKSQKILF